MKGGIQIGTEVLERGKATYFDGIDDNIFIGDKIDFEFQGMSTLLSFKINKAFNNNSNYQKLINKGQTSLGIPQNIGYSIRFVNDFNQCNGNTPCFSFQLISLGVIISKTSIPIDNIIKDDFLRASLVFDKRAGKMYSYLNEFKEEEDVIYDEDYNTNIPLAIGALNRGDFGGSSEFFNGTIDEVRIYNRALSEKEIKAVYGSTIK